MEILDMVLAALAKAQDDALEVSLCEALGLPEGFPTNMIWAFHGSIMVVCVLEQIAPRFVSPGKIVIPCSVVRN